MGAWVGGWVGGFFVPLSNFGYVKGPDNSALLYEALWMSVGCPEERVKLKSVQF